MWIPDVYQGAPTPVSGFMSTGAKAAAFSAFILVFAGQAATAGKLRTALALLAAASMLGGNIIALAQSNLKRMLAYSSIAHAGYMLAGLAAGNRLGRDGIVFYLVSYMFTNIGAFGVLSILEREEEKSLDYADYAGLGARTSVLDGGMQAWVAAGNPTTGVVPAARAGKLSPLQIRPLVVTADYVKSHIGSSGISIVDARS